MMTGTRRPEVVEVVGGAALVDRFDVMDVQRPDGARAAEEPRDGAAVPVSGKGASAHGSPDEGVVDLCHLESPK